MFAPVLTLLVLLFLVVSERKPGRAVLLFLLILLQGYDVLLHRVGF